MDCTLTNKMITGTRARKIVIESFLRRFEKIFLPLLFLFALSSFILDDISPEFTLISMYTYCINVPFLQLIVDMYLEKRIKRIPLAIMHGNLDEIIYVDNPRRDVSRCYK